MAEVKSKKYLYRNFLKWEGEKKGIVSSDDKPSFEVATPPEFRGHSGIWNPEELFVASVNCCIMTTFLSFAERNNLDFISYDSEAEGVLEMVESRFMMSEINIRPSIVVKNSSDIDKVKELIDRSEKNCLISNSIKSRVSVIPEIK